ncbi:polyprenol monophosphomannose synthase [candidate division KSB1 bacterium]|nr:MAG: polyprenol monophosphomannose synthase [candidate division KSB1 bacterium]RPH94935.1 MAG: polyprenol monophosphomannose synthase [candidate division KSB1 bacterium]
MKGLVVIPTYNERDTIDAILDAIQAQNLGLDILIVDDNSPDGTAQRVQERMKNEEHIKLIQRPGKMGLGTAYVAGFKFAIAAGYEIVIEMDADFSHDPGDLPRLVEKIKDYDFVLGSRYVNGVSVVNWPLRRLLLSYFASKYTRLITGMPVRDPTGGFKCFRIEVLKAIDLDRVKSGGYSFQIEMNFKAWKKGFRYLEIPIIFVDRRVGSSKMSKAIIREAVFMVWKLRLRSILGRL